MHVSPVLDNGTVDNQVTRQKLFILSGVLMCSQQRISYAYAGRNEPWNFWSLYKMGNPASDLRSEKYKFIDI